MTRARVRGIYATAITRLLLSADLEIVQASEPIRRRFEATFPDEPHDVRVETTDDRLGASVVGEPAGVESVAGRVAGAGVDALSWADPAPPCAVFEGNVTETLGSGAVVALGDREGFLPFDAADGYVDRGDRRRVQVREPAQPWSDHRHVLGTEVRVDGELGTLTRGESGVTADADRERATELVRTTELLSAGVPDGWGLCWDRSASDVGVDAMEAWLDRAGERAERIDEALGADPGSESDDGENGDCGGPGEGDDAVSDGGVPRRIVSPLAARWVRFGRESRFALDEHRRAVAPTMAGHHRIKAGTEAASTAVDFVEAVCNPDTSSEDSGDESAGDGFPFDAVTRQFGPAEGDRVRIDHGKPDGRSFSLGRAEITGRDPEGTVTLRRTIRSSGTYDALGTPRAEGDVAVTRIREGRWWYPTVYRSRDDVPRGTYVNVCTPVEVFPDAVRYVDLHVDVVRRPDGEVERVDDDELDAAVAAGEVPEALAERAREVAATVEDAL